MSAAAPGSPAGGAATANGAATTNGVASARGVATADAAATAGSATTTDDASAPAATGAAAPATGSAAAGQAGSAAVAVPFRYRPDIDALRGLAVLAVFIFHLNVDWLPGGFVGVDVFFVISGYVVTGSLLSHGSEPLGPRLGSFYLRRIRRLLPNLLLTLGVTALGVALLIPPSETRGFYLTAVKALYGWSNNHLLQASTDYFGLDSGLNPFVHTWSLGVEEQFYLVFPLLLILLGSGARRTLPLLLALIGLSLAASAWWTQQAPMTAFFLMPSRFWELAIGAALLLAQRRSVRAGGPAAQGRPGLGLSASWLQGRQLRWLGWLVVLAALVFTPERQGFPTPAALPAVLGTLLLLQAGPEADGRFLPSRPLERLLIALGLLSYSLYLWHWPVVTFLRWTTGLELPWQYLLATALSLGLAWLAYRWVEQPLRRRPLPPLPQLGLALAVVIGSWLGIDALAHPYRGQLFLGSNSDPVPRKEKISELRPVIAGTGISDADCGVPTWAAYGPESRTDFGPCSKPGRAGAGELFLLGDSHAHHLLPMLDAVTERTGQRISFTFKNSCLISPSLTVSFEKKRYEPCRSFAAGELERALQRLAPGDVLVMASWFNRQLGDVTPTGRENDFPVYAGGQRLSPAEVRRRFVADTRALARRLAARGIGLVLVVDVPMLAREPVVCGGWAQLAPVASRAALCSPDAELTGRMQRTVADTLAAAARGLANVHVFDPTPLLLERGRVRHRLGDGTVIYADSHHLSVSGSRRLAEPFHRFLCSRGLVPGDPSRQPPSS